MSDAILIHARSAAEVDRTRRLLDDAGIPYRTSLLVSEPYGVVFSVPGPRLTEARLALGLSAESAETDLLGPPEEAERSFPWGALQILVGLVLFHLLLVMLLRGPFPQGHQLYLDGALLRGATALQPWRLLTSLFLHSGVSHALGNGVSMIVFGLPLMASLGPARTAWVYLVAGVGGSVTALAFAEAGTRIVGSSGAVAGLFGAWLVLTLYRTRLEDLPGRARIRTLGVALLFLPSLLSPVSSSGNPVSISSHVGGLATGMLIGMVIARGLLSRWLAAMREARGL